MLKRASERNGHLGAIYALQTAPGGFYSAGADGYLVHWHLDDVDFGRVVARVDGGKFFSLAVLPDGGLVAGALDGGVHWLYPEAPDNNLHVAHHARPVYAVLRVGNELFTAGGDGLLTRWSIPERRTLESLPLSPNSLRCLAYEPHFDHLLVGASDGRVYTLSRDTFQRVSVHAANQPSVFTVAWPRHTSDHFVSGGRDARLLFHRVTGSGPAPEPITAHLTTINALAYSPGGDYLASVSRDKTVKLWDATRRPYELLKVAEVVRDRGHVNSVNTLLWLDDRTLFTAGDDRRILEWRVG